MPILRTEEQRERYCAFLKAQELPYKVDGAPYKPIRSNEQNAYLFGACYPPLCEATGYETEEVHEWMCGTYFGWIDVNVPKTPRNPDGVESRPKRTTTRNEFDKRDTLDKAEFSKFVDFVHRTAAKFGIFISEEWQG